MRNWLSMLFSESEGEPSIRRVVFALAFIFGVVLCFVGIKYEISKSVEAVAITLITAAFGVMGIGRFAEMLERRDR